MSLRLVATLSQLSVAMPKPDFTETFVGRSLELESLILGQLPYLLSWQSLAPMLVSSVSLRTRS